MDTLKPEAGTLMMQIHISAEDAKWIVEAYQAPITSTPIADLYRRDFVSPYSPRVRIRLSVPAHEEIDRRCLYAELIVDGFVRDFRMLVCGFTEPDFILEVPREIRMAVHLETANIPNPVPMLPPPKIV